MPAVRGKKRKGAKAKTECKASKKPSLSEDAEAIIADLSSSKPALENQNLKQQHDIDFRKNSFLSGENTINKTSEDISESNKNSEDLQEEEKEIQSKETKKSVAILPGDSNIEIEKNSSEDKDKDKLETHADIVNVDFSPPKCQNYEDEENPLAMLKIPIESKTKTPGLDNHSEDIQALGRFDNTGRTEFYGASFLSSSQPVTSDRISNIFCAKLSKRFKPPPTKYDLDMISRQLPDCPKEQENVLVEENASDDTFSRPQIPSKLPKLLSSEACQFDQVKECIDSINVCPDSKEKQESEKNVHEKVHFDSHNTTGIGENMCSLFLQQSREKLSNHVKENNSQGSDGQMNLKSKGVEGLFTEYHDNNVVNKSDVQSRDTSPQHSQETQPFDRAKSSGDDEERLYIPSSATFTNKHCLEPVFETQDTVADPLNDPKQCSGEKIETLNETTRSDKDDMILYDAESDAPKKNVEAVEMFLSPKFLNKIDQISFSPFAILPKSGGNCQNQRSPIVKSPIREQEKGEAMESFDDKKTSSFDKKPDEKTKNSSENQDSFIGKPMCNENLVRHAPSKNTDNQKQVKSPNNSESNSIDQRLFITEVSNIVLRHQSDHETAQEKNKGEIEVESGFFDTTNTSVKTRPFEQDLNEKEKEANCSDGILVSKEETNTLSLQMQTTDLMSEKPNYKDIPNKEKQDSVYTFQIDPTITDAVSSDYNVNVLSGKAEGDNRTSQEDQLVTEDILKVVNDEMAAIRDQHYTEINFNNSEDSASRSNNFSIPKCCDSNPSLSVTETIEIKTCTRNELNTATNVQESSEEENNISIRQNPVLVKSNTLSITAKLIENDQVSEMDNDKMIVDKIIDILSEPKAGNDGCKSLNTNTQSEEISFTTKTQSYTLSETLGQASEHSDVDLEQSLADALDDFQSTKMDVHFSELDPQAYLLDSDNKDLESYQEDINRLEGNFHNNQTSAVEQVNKKRAEGASIIKTIMGDLMFTNRQLVKMKKEMDLLSHSLDRISKQKDIVDKGGCGFGGW